MYFGTHQPFKDRNAQKHPVCVRTVTPENTPPIIRTVAPEYAPKSDVNCHARRLRCIEYTVRT